MNVPGAAFARAMRSASVSMPELARTTITLGALTNSDTGAKSLIGS